MMDKAENCLTRRKVGVLSVDGAVIAVKEELLPVRHRLAVTLNALLVVGVQGCQVKEPWSPSRELQLEEPS